MMFRAGLRGEAVVLSRPLRILMIAPNPFFIDRGFSVRVYEEARELMKLGHRVAICTYHAGRDLPGFDIRRVPRQSWYGDESVGASWSRLYLDLLLFRLSLNECRRFKPDIIHGHIHEGGLIGGLIGRSLGVPLLFDLTGSLVGELREKGMLKKQALLAKVFGFAERRIDNAADVVVTTSSRMFEDLVANRHVPEDRIRVTMDGVNTEDFAPGLGKQELRDRLGIPPDQEIVVYLGLLTTYQGVDCLINSIPHVLAGRPATHFLIMGYPNVEKYRAMASSLGVGDNATFTGRIEYPRAAEHIGLGAVAVSPKLLETEANGKLYNYMACGVPTVAFDTTVNREILGDTGAYARLGDPVSLAKEIVHLLSDKSPAERMGREARKRAVLMFSWANVAKQLVECYHRAILSRRSRGAP